MTTMARRTAASGPSTARLPQYGTTSVAPPSERSRCRSQVATRSPSIARAPAWAPEAAREGDLTAAAPGESVEQAAARRARQMNVSLASIRWDSVDEGACVERTRASLRYGQE